jgi:hypothetical protein
MFLMREEKALEREAREKVGEEREKKGRNE